MHMPIETKRWTLAEVHSLPDDGNKYELIDGELFVTPSPTDGHETIAVRLARILEPYVVANDLGYIYRPRAVFRIDDRVEVEPDLMVRQLHPGPDATWETARLPLLVVEIASDSTRRRDRVQKRNVYVDAGIPDYWIVDEDTRSIRVLRPDCDDIDARETVTWAPAGVGESLTFDVARVFG